MGAPQAQHTPLRLQQGPRSGQDAQAGLTALEADSRAAQAQYETHPTDAGALLQWRQAHHTLQQLNAGVAQAAALQAGVVWQHYGEQSTFWFYHLARERREQTVIAQLGTAGQPGHIKLDTYASTQQAGQALEGYFSASSPEYERGWPRPRICFGAFAAYTPPFAAIPVPFESAMNSLSIDTTLAR